MSEDVKSVITCDLDGKIETYSEGAETLFGYTPDEVIGKERVSLFSPGRVVLGHVTKWLKEAREKGAWDGDTVFIKKGGEKLAAHIRITPTYSEDKHVGYCGVTTPLEDADVKDVEPKISLVTKIFSWFVITRAPFLTATLVPVLLGGAVTSLLGYTVDPGLLGMTLLAAALLHVGTNTANDYFDYTSGTDDATFDYIVPFTGGSRSIQMGLISSKGMLTVSLVSFVLGGIVAIPLILKAGLGVLYLGIIGALSGLFYTAPPLRFCARKGLGELIVALNFGPLIVAGSTLVQTGRLEPVAFLAGIPVGLLTAAILWINEFPDLAGDKATGKKTLVVVLGKVRARYGYVLLVGGAFTLIGVMAFLGVLPLLSLIVLPALYLAVTATRTMFRHYDDRLLRPANAGTINLHLVTGVLLIVGVWLG
ncbi:MAG: 1,4-dihydroxy-2-naphthoate octaprenyltransferase [Candidatus Neomarinimicrobiota bacterium]